LLLLVLPLALPDAAAPPEVDVPPELLLSDVPVPAVPPPVAPTLDPVDPDGLADGLALEEPEV
jgi:hypothetical protein